MKDRPTLMPVPIIRKNPYWILVVHISNPNTCEWKQEDQEFKVVLLTEQVPGQPVLHDTLSQKQANKSTITRQERWLSGSEHILCKEEDLRDN